ncbi:MAG: hypothetical protein BM563_10340 [Bacteroidetes bacterium MedPE-SWsnd-G1]|nr:MAG: hypothetical protein BM563_10340 [Bacteroidetes bacterium MedPE-SWsnd-G1]
MIKFFRKIRQQLLNEGKTSKYFKYAIGEIVLVVIGILIALQINTWNQERLNNIERQNIIASLNSEFLKNKTQFISVKEDHDNSKRAAMEFMEYIGEQNHQNFTQNEIDILIHRIFPMSDYVPSNNAIDDIIQSGKLSTLKNSELSSKLSDWKSLMSILSSRDDKMEVWVFNQLIPYLNKFISWRDVGVQNNYNWSTQGTLPTDYKNLFTDLEFENILENHIYFVNQSLRRQNEALNLIDEIIELTSTE